MGAWEKSKEGCRRICDYVDDTGANICGGTPLIFVHASRFAGPSVEIRHPSGMTGDERMSVLLSLPSRDPPSVVPVKEETPVGRCAVGRRKQASCPGPGCWKPT